MSNQTLENSIPNSPKETLDLNSTPTEIANFTRGLKLSQFRYAIEHFDASPYGRKIVVAPLIELLNQAAKYAK